LLLLGGHATHKSAALVMIAVGGATIGAVYLLLARLLRLEALEVLLTGLRRRVARV
jgi:hypothetical protein